VTALDRKLLRDLWHTKGQAIAICLVIACGVASFIMMLCTLDSLERSQQRYYDRYRFANVFATLKRAPNALTERIAEIPGVAHVQTRIVHEVNLDVPGLVEPAVGRLLSIPETHPPELNGLHLRSGRYIEPGRPGEVLVTESFAEANRLAPGDSIGAVINGRKESLRIVGVALSPEYILAVRSGDTWPDDRRFGVFWMGRRELEAAFDMEGGFNDLVLTLTPAASEPEVIRAVDALIERYGGLGAYGRDDQVSHRYLSDEIRGLRGSGLIIPIIFLSVAAFMLNVVLSRLIATQRGEIGTLKAFGYGRGEVAMHFLKLALLIVFAGAVLGIGFGGWLGRGLTAMYARFYRFPVFEFSFDLGVVLWGLIVSVVAAVLGVFGAVRGAVRLPPAEAMRPEPPAAYRPTVLERWGFQRWMTQGTRMILRNLERRPLKAALSALGIAFAAAILVVGSFNEDSLNYMMDFQFKVVQRQNMSLAFVEPKADGVLHEIRNLPGVFRAEGFRALPVRLRSDHRARRLAIIGLEPDAELHRLMDESARPMAVPPDGLVVSATLARVLQVRPGETLRIEVLEGKRPVGVARVVAIIEEFAGVGAYMDIRALNRLAREGPSISGAHLMVDAARIETLYRTLKTTPGVASVTVKDAALESFRETVAENLLRLRVFTIIFASIIAVGVVYNTARISLSERTRELATLRVIGFRRAEISLILLGELGALVLAAIPVGLVIGYSMCGLVARAYDTELYRVPLVVERATFGFAAIVVLVAALVSGLIVRRRLDHLDLIAVLKTTE
jgi:putative ABC transport system permease protein